MGTSAEESQSNQQSQQYDTTFEDWIEQQASSILPILLPGASYQQTLTVELVRPVLRADKVFKILYHGLALRRVLVYVVKAQYPTLTELAQEKVERLSKPDALDLLVQQVSTAPNEETARWLLSAAA